ncbi:MAG: hypothetical protein KAR24_01620 [Candidatus Pacebacteria bacterium]|nr:hypothetical protein [Candidatus Paceibacterota bacterium]
MGDTNNKRESLKAIVLLLIGFIIGFATHAFTTTEDIVVDEILDTTVGENLDEGTTTEDGEVSEDTVVTDDGADQAAEIVDATANNAAAGEYSISVIDQEAGNIVHVSQAVLENEAWVAIREDRDGQLGNILGAYRYPAGTNSGSVELLRGTEKGNIYYAVIYIDDGDKDFDFKKDTIVEENGKVLAAKFLTY